MRNFYFIFLFLFSTSLFSQIKGTVTDTDNNPLPFVNIYIEGTYTGTTSNDNGDYELPYIKKETITLVFQNLGYKTRKENITIADFPYKLSVKLQEEDFVLQELTLSDKENPADKVIRKAIEFKKINSAKTDKFEADFYSRGIFRAKNIPKKFMGVEIGDLDGNLDSLGSGIIYQSETVSQIKFEKPNNYSEKIIASKVAGDSNGFSFNTALDTNYDFYENTIGFNIKMISPLADNAFNYYKYKLESTFYNDANQLVNKIEVIAKRDKEPVFEGYIYIVENAWSIYGVDLDILGYRSQQPILEKLKLTQNFSYNQSNEIWVKNLQTLDFKAGIFGINFNGKFTHVFTNYVFKNEFDKKTFGNEVVSFEKSANKKDNTYWQTTRPVPLTNEELSNYIKKDSIYTVRNSQKYLDSLDSKSNKFKISDVIKGYSYSNSFQKWSLNYVGLLNFENISFNTVQGYSLQTGFTFRKKSEENGKMTSISSSFNYGFAEDRLRVTGDFYHRFNNINYATITASGGSAVSQFNNSDPISNIVNSVSTLFFKNNFMKLYNKEFLTASYAQDVSNGINVNGSATFEDRHALLNNTDFSIIKTNDSYSSNDPLNPYDEKSMPFEKHNIIKTKIAARFNFAQKYITRPDGRIRMKNNKYPTISVGYEKAFSTTNSKYQYDLILGSLTYEKTFGNKGEFKSRFNTGQFFNADNISFIDYKHFNGNLTHVSFRGNYLNSFMLLPYYSNSTNDSYLETHLEHNFKGYIMNKIPLLNKLQWNLVTSFHQINVPKAKPYQEYSVGFTNIGFGKFRFFRFDYVRSYQNDFNGDGILFGIQF